MKSRLVYEYYNYGCIHILMDGHKVPGWRLGMESAFAMGIGLEQSHRERNTLHFIHFQISIATGRQGITKI